MIGFEIVPPKTCWIDERAVFNAELREAYNSAVYDRLNAAWDAADKAGDEAKKAEIAAFFEPFEDAMQRLERRSQEHRDQLRENIEGEQARDAARYGHRVTPWSGHSARSL